MDTLERGTQYYKPPVRFQRAEAVRQEREELKALFERKHFPEMLRLLYREKTVRQKDVVEELGINKAVVCLNMNELDAIGFVRQRKEGRCKTYHLLRKGSEYYEAHFLPESERSPVEIAIPEEAKETIRYSLGETEPLQDALVKLLERVDKALEKLSGNAGEQIWMDQARENVPEAEELTKAFRAVAERNDKLVYYYMGEYEAKLSWLKAGLEERRDGKAQETVTRSRHFNTILRLLYEEKTLYQRDIVERLGITRGNTAHHLKAMKEAGFIEEEREGTNKTYRLSPAGEQYYRENGPEPEPPVRKAGKQAKVIRQKAAEKPVTVLNEKNFATIMQVLYETGGIPLTDLCERLDRTHGNVYRDMRNLTSEGFVMKEMIEHCNIYTLSDKGLEYCEACFA